jgi:hypothetical protein
VLYLIVVGGIMAKLAMALRCIDGIVLGGDMPFGDMSENEGVIRPLSEFVAILIHDERSFGNWLVDEFLASSPKLDVPIGEIAEQAHNFFDSKCKELADQHQPIPLMGAILAGIDKNGIGGIEFHGLHVAYQFFTPRVFGGNVFGGENHAIARFLDRKIYTFSISVDSALRLAAFYFAETRSIPALRLEPSLSLATITYSNGFRSVDRERVKEYLSEASRWSEWLFAACASILSPISDSETEERK